MNHFARTCQLQAEKIVPASPLNVMLELSARCPQKCPMCPLQGSDERLAREEGLMDENLFRSLIDQMACDPPEVLRLHYSGESTVHPKFGELGRYARRSLPKTWIHYNTGGLLWTTPEKRRDWLSIDADMVTFSIEANRWLQDGLHADGGAFDTMTKRREVKTAAERYVVHPYRAGAPWDVCVPNLIATANELAAMKREGQAMRTELHVQHMITKEQKALDIVDRDGTKTRTTWEVEFSRAYWSQFGVVAQAVPVASIGGQVDNNSMRNDAFARRPMGRCREVYTNFVIAWNGKVAPCCVDHSFSLFAADEVSVSKMSWLEAWNHPAVVSLRDKHGAGVGYPEKCVKCLGAL